MTNDVQIPPPFDMPASRVNRRREQLAAEFERSPNSPRPGRGARRWLVAVAAAGCAVVATTLLVGLVESDSSGPGVIEKAVAATTSDASVYHVVVRFTERHQTKDPRVLEAFDQPDLDFFQDRTEYGESWTGPAGRERLLMYETDRGRRGRLLIEQASDENEMYHYDARLNCISKSRIVRRTPPRRLRRPPPGYVPPPRIDPRGDPGAQLKTLQEQDALRLAGTEEVGGRTAHRLVSKTWRAPGKRGHTERVEFLVDPETYLPLEERHTGTQWGIPGLESRSIPAEMYETPVTTRSTREFLVYEKLPPTKENLAKLAPKPRPGARVFDPHSHKPTCD